MLNVISNAVATLFINNGIADEEDRDIYIYSVNVLLYNVATFIFILVLSFLFHNVIETLVFLLTFVSLRRYTGGYHAETRIKCFLASVTVYVLAVIVGTYFTDRGAVWILSLVMIICSCMLILFSPINSDKMQFSENKMNKFRVKSRVSLGILLVLACVLYYFQLSEYAVYISLGIISTSISLMIEIMKRRRKKNSEK